MARKADHYNVDEAARILGVSPARVRQMLRAGEIEGERGRELMEGVPGPWRLPASAVHAFREHEGAADAETTVALPPGADLPGAGEKTAGTPSATSERLSEGVSELRKKAQELLGDLDRLEGQLEANEVEELALREALKRERDRADALHAELEAEKKTRGRTEARGSWRRLLGG